MYLSRSHNWHFAWLCQSGKPPLSFLPSFIEIFDSNAWTRTLTIHEMSVSAAAAVGCGLSKSFWSTQQSRLLFVSTVHNVARLRALKYRGNEMLSLFLFLLMVLVTCDVQNNIRARVHMKEQHVVLKTYGQLEEHSSQLSCTQYWLFAGVAFVHVISKK